ncbi:hypothetical protein ACOMHN_047956 [Nucella lapillus]
MDPLAALNIVPFLGLMNLVEVRYLDMPEVYRTMLAILCDYDPLLQDNIVKTRRYLSELLAREPELAQCLLNFIDLPEQPATSSVASDGSATVTKKNQNCQQCTSEQVTAKITEEKPADFMPKETNLIPEQFCPDFGANSQSSRKTDVPKPDYHDICFISTPTSATIREQSNIHPSPGVVTEAPVPTMGQPPAVNPPTTYSDHMPKSVPFLNIHHRDLCGSEKSTVAVSIAGSQPQPTPFFLPGFFASHMNSGELSGLDRTPKPATTHDQRDQMIFTSNLTPSGSQAQMEADSSSFLTQVTDCSKGNMKASKQSSVAETQTLLTGAEKTSLCDGAASAETSVPFQLPRIPSSTSSLDTLISMAISAGSSLAASPNLCLSKLLGQPSVAYLPAGHFIDSRSSLVDPAVKKATSIEKLPYSSSILSGRTTSAAAKLHLLSTQAGSEKSGLFQAGCGKASVTGSLSASVPLLLKENTMKTTVKVTSKPGCKKTITFSKIVPVLKLDTLTGQENKVSTLSYDKQIQVGQRQLCSKKSQTTGRNEQTYQTQPDPTQLVNNADSHESLQGRRQLEDCQNTQCVYQLADRATTHLDWEKRQKETRLLSESQQKCLITRTIRAIKLNCQNSTARLEEETVKPSVSEQKPMSEKMDQNKQLLHEAQGGPKLVCGQDEGWVAASLSDKARQESEKVLSLTAGGNERQKVQVVAVSMGGSHSLSAFPYIQQMILPDGQVSTIAHNSFTAASYQPAELQHSDAASTVCLDSKPPETMQERKDLPSKPAAQIVLPRSQLKLSVSIQTPSANPSQKRNKNTTTPLVDLPKINKRSPMIETAQTRSEVLKMKGQGKSFKTYVDTTSSADSTNLLPDAPTGASQGKRKRSPTSRRNVMSKAVKLHL